MQSCHGRNLVVSASNFHVVIGWAVCQMKAAVAANLDGGKRCQVFFKFDTKPMQFHDAVSYS